MSVIRGNWKKKPMPLITCHKTIFKELIFMSHTHLCNFHILCNFNKKVCFTAMDALCTAQKIKFFHTFI